LIDAPFEGEEMKSKLLQPISKRPPMAETPSKPALKKAAPKPATWCSTIARVQAPPFPQDCMEKLGRWGECGWRECYAESRTPNVVFYIGRSGFSLWGLDA
jgi:hypothetical protein